MFKSKLQELCQRHRWELPEYDLLREGPDHTPRFQAEVFVNGLSFQSDGCRTIKQAENEAARIAFRHFSNSSTGSSPANNVAVVNTSEQQRLPQERTINICDSQLSASVPIVEDDNRTKGTSPKMDWSASDAAKQQDFQQETWDVSGIREISISTPIVKDDNRTEGLPFANTELTNNFSIQQTFQVQKMGRDLGSSVLAPVVNDSNKTNGMHNLYKNQLQTYAQKQNLGLPTYMSEREGPSHASRFRSKVIVGDQTFESQEFFPTLKEAEHAVAKIALATLVPNSSQEEDRVVYKNLLQEMAQKEGYQLPAYTTTRSGAAHFPTFISSVEVAGKVFGGKEAKTKKLAEMSAAKMAYMSLKEGMLCKIPPVPVSSQQQELPHQATPDKSIVLSGGDLPKQHLKRRPAYPDVPCRWEEVPEEARHSQTFPEDPLVRTPKTIYPDVPSECIDEPEEEPPLPDLLHQLPNFSTESQAEKVRTALLLDQNAILPPVINDDNTEIGGEEVVSGEKVVVRSMKSGMTLPSGSEVVFKDEKWVAYRIAPETKEARER